MTKSERTLLFNLCVAVFNIVLGLAVELTLIFILLFILPHIPGASESIPTQTLLPFVLLAGLFAAMVISVRCISWAIKKFNLAEKINENAVKRYIHDDSENLRHL